MFRIINIVLLLSVMFVGTVSADVIDGEELVDPTRPFAAIISSNDTGILDLLRTVIPSSYDLSFIRAGGSSSIAVINDQRVTVGDTIGGAEVLAIDYGGVTLLVNNVERRISLYDTIIKSTPADC
ncbi:MAG: hypothetical protein COA96_14740 [SAR86 cluster bacterium]|uniref:Uncharacterized protein n=1 Tax=SAR86 cluster bacterium TaxID=2030880 RepID=A0A2A5ASS5_9GAMM|nr:MAG: hypothetical protein COA96_14740 [SAR86 cluster bacterium]